MMDQKENSAQEAFENYRFEDGITVQAHDGWDSNDESDYTKLVYVSFEEDAEDDDSHKVSFHVEFDKSMNVIDSYALDIESGNEL